MDEFRFCHALKISIYNMCYLAVICFVYLLGHLSMLNTMAKVVTSFNVI